MERGDSFLRSCYFYFRMLVRWGIGMWSVLCCLSRAEAGASCSLTGSTVLFFFFVFVSFLLKLLEEEGGTPCCVWAVRGVIYFRSLAALGCGGSVCSFSDFRGRIQIGEERAALRSISDRFFFFCSVFVCFFLGGFVF